MAGTVITLDDLQKLKTDLLSEIKNLMSERQGVQAHKWIKTRDLRKLLPISKGKLQVLRLKGILPFTRIGGAIYYDIEDVEKMLRENKNNRKISGR